MPNPTSTALNVNDNFSGSNLNPQHGDVARQGPGAMKSSTTSASAACPAQPAADAADHTKRLAWSYASAITVKVDGAGNFTYDPGPDVGPGGKVTLKSTGKVPIAVETNAGTLKEVFTSSWPYTATLSGEDHWLVSATAGQAITLKTAMGTNGTINVGGGHAPPPPGDGGGSDGDDHHHHLLSHSRA